VDGELLPPPLVDADRMNAARRLRIAVLVALLWTALGFFFASQLYLAGVPWRSALTYAMPQWYAWGLLTPGIFWVDRRFLGNGILASRVAWHIPLGIAWTLLCIALRLVTRPLRGAEPPASVRQFFLQRFYWDLLIYAVIAGVSIARDFAARAKEHERQTHQLALEAADLERKLVEARLQSLRAQLQPHFLFNALNTISAFTETDSRTARRLMEQLGNLLRASLAHASRPLVTLADELTFLDNYLAIESARFEGRITISVHADDDLLCVMVPSFLLQPLVENAIRHGVAPRLSGGHVDVTATRVDSALQLRVRDDGVGLCPGWEFDRNAGIGLRNVVSRVEHSFGRADLLRIVPAASGGVEVQLNLPLQPALAIAALVSEIPANA
jgi:two-component system LytT family sensor kinase